jgi:hypothetical protein
MGDVNWLAVGLGTLLFFGVGAIWYTVLFGRLWRAEMGITPEMVAEQRAKGGVSMFIPLVVSLVAEFLVVTMMAHLIARTSPAPHVILMYAIGFGGFVMAPAIAINYAYQQRSLRLFVIDAGHFVVGLLAVAGLFIAMG